MTAVMVIKRTFFRKKIARFQTERNRGSHSPIVTKTEKECKNSSVLDFCPVVLNFILAKGQKAYYNENIE